MFLPVNFSSTSINISFGIFNFISFPSIAVLPAFDLIPPQDILLSLLLIKVHNSLYNFIFFNILINVLKSIFSSILKFKILFNFFELCIYLYTIPSILLTQPDKISKVLTRPFHNIYSVATSKYLKDIFEH